MKMSVALSTAALLVVDEELRYGPYGRTAAWRASVSMPPTQLSLRWTHGQRPVFVATPLFKRLEQQIGRNVVELILWRTCGGWRVRAAERRLPRDGRRAWACFARLAVHVCVENVSQKRRCSTPHAACVYGATTYVMLCGVADP